jgi:hypothetical protein
MKTAVEFMVEQLNKSIGLTKFVDTCDEDYKQEILGIIEQAKAMEKEQHSKTWDVALDKYEVRAGNYMRAYEDFDEYYNETFKSE